MNANYSFDITPRPNWKGSTAATVDLLIEIGPNEAIRIRNFKIMKSSKNQGEYWVLPPSEQAFNWHKNSSGASFATPKSDENGRRVSYPSVTFDGPKGENQRLTNGQQEIYDAMISQFVGMSGSSASHSGGGGYQGGQMDSRARASQARYGNQGQSNEQFDDGFNQAEEMWGGPF